MFLRITYILLCLVQFVYSQQGDRFVFTQLKYGTDWDPYQYIYQDILTFVTVATSIKVVPERRIVTLRDELLFSSPLLIILGGTDFPELSYDERRIIRNYVSCGGTIFIDNSAAIRNNAFELSIKRELSKIFPEYKLTKLPLEHPIYRSFYLLRALSGRKIVTTFLEGIDIDNRTAIIYSNNDIFGVWARDKFGKYFWNCDEKQRFEAQKLTINLIVFSLTGTYKTDIVHQDYIKQKLFMK